MDTTTFAICFCNASKSVADCRDELCRLDTGIGDGDHGITAERGFLAAADLSEKFDGVIGDLFLQVGKAMGQKMGGAIGPVYSAFFTGAASAFESNDDVVEPVTLALAVKAGVEKVIRIGQVREGDKTVVDAMGPCARAMAEAQGKDLSYVVNAGAKAAIMGRDATRDMVARKGRARFLGERSKGHIDAGAASFTIFMQALAKEISLRG